ncbi:MAG TPA: SurA N-terminal domain-containing protein, partial [Myxococcota bacterium]|nr:SurA N-terminal domain-containing protein [Myxococcota bacterium]
MLSMLAFAWLLLSPPAPAVLDRVAASVDGEAVLLSELLSRAGPARLAAGTAAPEPGAPLSPAERGLLGQVLDGLIRERLVAAEAGRLGMAVSPEEVEVALGAVAAQNGLERSALLAELPGLGFSEASYRVQLGHQLLRARLLQVRMSNRARPPGGPEAWQAQAVLEDEALDRELEQTAAIERLLELPAPARPAQDPPPEAARAPGCPGQPGLPEARAPLVRAPAPWPAARLARVTVVSSDPWRAALGRLLVSTHPGEPLDTGRVAADLRRLWAEGDAAELWAEARTGAEGLELVYVQRPRAVLGSLTLSAPAGLGRSEAGELLELTPQAPLDPRALRRAERELGERLRRRGYLEARLAWHHRMQPSGLALPAPVELCLQVQPGPRYHIGPLRFTGNRRLSEQQLRACIGPEPLERAWAEPDLAAMLLQACYYDRGMIQARVEAPAPSAFRTGRVVALSVRIEEGEIYSLGGLRVQGALAAPEADYLAALGLASGACFSRAEV